MFLGRATLLGLGLGLDIGRIEDATLSQSKATETSSDASKMLRFYKALSATKRTLVISPLEGK